MRRGEIWRINLDPTIGAEIRKTRPAIIVNDDGMGILPLKIIVPITDWKDRYEEAVWMTKIMANEEKGLSKTSSADAFQVRSVSQDRFIEKLGIVSDKNLEEITESLALVLKIQ